MTIEAGLVHHQAGRFSEAAACYLNVLNERPDDPDALNLLASATRSLGDAATALQLLRKASEIAPFRTDIHYNLGNAAQAVGHQSEALAAWEEAVRLDPRHADALANIGVMRGKFGEYAEAVAMYEQALAIDPGHRIAGHNIGNALGELGRAEEATQRFREAIRRHPDLDEARYNLSLALLRRGDFANGFKNYEARWHSADFSHPQRHTTIANWDGTPFGDKRLLIHAEQGFGDTLQFIRLVRMAATLGSNITLELPDPLVALAAPFADVAQIVGESRLSGEFDLQSPLLGLPYRLGLTLGSVPAKVPYLTADRGRIAFWRARLDLDDRPVIGLCWRGNPKSPADRGRSIRVLEDLAGFAVPTGARVVSLMKLDKADLEPSEGPLGWQVRKAPFPIEHAGPTFDDAPDAFLDTAALMMLCGAVVTTDTSIAHLAGALARPTVTLLKRVPDWRWLTGTGRTVWYPTMRLIRQAESDEWAPVLTEASAAVATLLEASARSAA